MDAYIYNVWYVITNGLVYITNSVLKVNRDYVNYRIYQHLAYIDTSHISTPRID